MLDANPDVPETHSTVGVFERRVLIVAPTHRDATITRDILVGAGLTCLVCQGVGQAVREIRLGAGVLLLTEDAFKSRSIEELMALLRDQPAWSDLPVVILMQGQVRSSVASGVLKALGNVTLLERPAPVRSVISAVEAALRGRGRQYEIRDQIDSVRKAEMRARDLQFQLKIAIEASELGTFHCEFPLGVLLWNDLSKAHFWLPPEAEVDIDLFYELLHPEDRERTRAAIASCLDDGQIFDVEYRTVSPTGAIRWIRATGRTVYDAQQSPLQFDGTTQDITDRRQRDELRQRLLESERSARREAERVSNMKDEFLATLSHELRTPLNAIFGWTQILKISSDDAELMAEGINVIDRNVRVQTQLIEDLLDMSRIISGKVRLDVQSVNLYDVLVAATENVKPAAQAKQLQLERVIDPSLGTISGDPGRLQQVFWNLLTNAIKFTPKGGRVHVLAERVSSHIEVTVSDSGDGISEEFLPYLFERFSQADASARRKHGGLGLGLSIVKNLVELHGGAIRASSAGEGQGASFVVELPLRVTKATEAESQHPGSMAVPIPFDREQTRLEGLKVLVVDDERDARELVRHFLMQCGAEPVLAGSADEADSVISTFAPQVIISDVGMPSRDGYQFMRDLRNQGLRTPALALTAFARAEDRIRSVQAGYQAHLPKPVEPAELIAVVAGLAKQF